VWVLFALGVHLFLARTVGRNFENRNADETAQNRRGQTIEQTKVFGAPSFSPYHPFAVSPIRRHIFLFVDQKID
jgi:hypothetical protein